MNIPGTQEETATIGLDGLDKRCQDYYKAGARFAKWFGLIWLEDLLINCFDLGEQLSKFQTHCLLN